jgi:anti-anti-sigma factor
MLYRLRTTLLRICIGGQIERINRSEAALAFSDTSARLLADSDLEHVCGLGWLTGSGITTALLGLWQRDEPGALLRIAGRFPSSSDTTQLGMRAAMFPPMALLESDQFAPVTILPLRSARRKWGFLALAFLETLESAAFDCAPLLAALLTARIEGAMLQREREAEQAALQTAFERERSLAETIRELGCPVLPISQAILLVPLIGVIDSYRAEQILGTVVRTIEQSRTETVLLDVTGVPLIDTHVAGMLIQLAQMLRLLGARTILVGVRPEIAQSIVALGVNLDQLTTYSSLMAALAALKQ